jgi:hypothetical protein
MTATTYYAVTADAQLAEAQGLLDAHVTSSADDASRAGHRDLVTSGNPPW